MDQSRTGFLRTFEKKKFLLLYFFDKYKYEKMQNGLKRMFFHERKKNWF